MSAERATYLDSSAIVKPAEAEAEAEAESAARRRYPRRRRPLVSSALAKAEVARALLPLGEPAVRRGGEVLARVELIRISDRVLAAAGSLLPAELRTPDAIHLATAHQLGSDLARIVTYDERLRAAATSTGCAVAAPR
jgi:predicted nucleic acid-binding protein